MTIREAREHFLSYLEAERGYSPLTITAYRSDIKQFTAHLDGKGSIPTVNGLTLGPASPYEASADIQRRAVPDICWARQLTVPVGKGPCHGTFLSNEDRELCRPVGYRGGVLAHSGTPHGHGAGSV